jgi:D-alanyl-D-alanine dipeptidase
VDVQRVDSSLIVDLRYATSNNFHRRAITRVRGKARLSSG